MKYLRLLKGTSLLLLLLLFSSINLGSHATAMSAMDHESAFMNHQFEDNNSCATQCRMATVNKDDITNPLFDEEDDEPNSRFYSVSDEWRSDKVILKQKLYGDLVKPPSKVPIYILYGVFRA